MTQPTIRIADIRQNPLDFLDPCNVEDLHTLLDALEAAHQRDQLIATNSTEWDALNLAFTRARHRFARLDFTED